MTLDVIIVSYRSRELVPRCVRAALDFAPDARVVVVENSLDSWLTVQPLNAPSAIELIMNGQNLGYAAAVNRGLSATNGEIILLLNPDVTAIEGDFGAIAAEFRAQPRLAAVTPQLVGPDGVLEATCRREPRPFDLVAEWLDLTKRFPNWRRAKRFRMLDISQAGDRQVVDAATGACLFLRREAIDDVGRFDESYFMYWEETDWLVRAKRAGWSTLFLPDVRALHLGRQSSSVRDEMLSLLLLESQHHYARKHFGRAAELVLRVALICIDAVRWAFAPGGSANRSRVAARLRVHVTGRAPRPA